MRNIKLYNFTLRDEDGSVAIITALIVVFIILGTAALAIDIGRQTTAKNELQNALDASALAGAIELGQNGSANVKDKAKEAAINNAIDNNSLSLDNNDIYIGNWDEPDFYNNTNPHNAVKVRVDGHSIDSFFASTLNFSQKVSAEATAVIGTLGGKSHLIPIAVTHNQAIEMENHEGEEVIYEAGRSAGNWGTVDLNAIIEDNQGGGNPEIGDWLKDGYNGTILIGDDINTESGVGKIVGGGNAQTVEDYLIDKKVFIPVIDKFYQGSSASDKNLSEVLGFIAIKITDINKQGNDTTIKAIYLGSEVTSGPIDLDEDLYRYGPIGIALVE